MFQEIEQVGMGKTVEGFSTGGGGELRLLLDRDEVALAQRPRRPARPGADDRGRDDETEAPAPRRRKTPPPRPALRRCLARRRHRACRAAAWRISQTALSLLITFFGLLFVTFFIGRIIPIDPALAVVGERASQAQYEAARAGARPRQAAPHAVRDLCRRRADRRFRQVAADRPPGRARTSPASSPRRSSSPPSPR